MQAVASARGARASAASGGAEVARGAGAPGGRERIAPILSRVANDAGLNISGMVEAPQSHDLSVE